MLVVNTLQVRLTRSTPAWDNCGRSTRQGLVVLGSCYQFGHQSPRRENIRIFCSLSYERRNLRKCTEGRGHGGNAQPRQWLKSRIGLSAGRISGLHQVLVDGTARIKRYAPTATPRRLEDLRRCWTQESAWTSPLADLDPDLVGSSSVSMRSYNGGFNHISSTPAGDRAEQTSGPYGDRALGSMALASVCSTFPRLSPATRRTAETAGETTGERSVRRGDALFRKAGKSRGLVQGLPSSLTRASPFQSENYSGIIQPHRIQSMSKDAAATAQRCRGGD